MKEAIEERISDLSVIGEAIGLRNEEAIQASDIIEERQDIRRGTEGMSQEVKVEVEIQEWIGLGVLGGIIGLGDMKGEIGVIGGMTLGLIIVAGAGVMRIEGDISMKRGRDLLLIEGLLNLEVDLIIGKIIERKEKDLIQSLLALVRRA